MRFLLLIFPVLAWSHDEPRTGIQKALSQYTHESWTSEDGLPQNSVNAVVQTPDGYVWIGTQEGLVRFDGVRFTVFDKRNTPAINNNYITALLVDNAGTLWIGTYEGGLTTYRSGTFTTVTAIPQLSNGNVHFIYQDKKGKIWVALREHGVIRINGGQSEILDTSKGLCNNEIWGISEDIHGRVWFATEGGISILDHDTFTTLTVKDGLISNHINEIIPASEKEMWLGTNNGIMKIPIDLHAIASSETYTTKEGLPYRIVYHLQVDKKGSLWIGTRYGIARLSEGRIVTFIPKNGLNNTRITELLIDREDNIWIGTDGNGLHVLRDGLFTTFTTDEGLPANTIWSVYEDSQFRKWVATDAGLVCMLHEQDTRLKIYTHADGLYDNAVYSTAVDHDGTVWVCTANGVMAIKNDKVIPVQPLERTKNLITSGVIVDRKNRVWVATTGKGVLKFDHGTCTSLTTAQGLASNYIGAVYEDASGNIWIGTDGNGVAILTDSGMVTLSSKQGFSSNFIHSFYVDQDSTMWIGTFGGGLNRYAHGKITSITSKQGLFDDVIYQILEDNYGRLWMTSNKGIFHVNKNELQRCADGIIAKVSCTAYGKENGLKSIECNGGVQPAGWKAHDGTLWFPTEGGLATINPKAISVNRQPPLVAIENLFVDNQNVPLTSSLVIGPDKDRVEIHFTGISFLSPKKVHFKVKLEGYDKTWDDLGTRRTSYYTNLPPGTYTFRVIAANSDGVWNMEGASLTFTRDGYFYQTKIFILCMLVLFIGGGYGAYRMRVRTIHRRQEHLEELIDINTHDLRKEQEKTEQLLQESELQKEAAEKANTMKSQLLDMVAHHLKSPLISITGLTREVEQSTSLNELALKYLKMIRFGADRMVSIINDLLSLSAIESGEITFRMEKINFAEITAVIIDGYKFRAQSKEQVLTFVADDSDELTVLVDPQRMQEAVENLVSNAIKYSPTHTVIRSGIYRHNGKIRFWITDSGPGISEEDRQLLFKKFQILSAKPTGGEIATGLGLAIVKEIVELHRGQVFVEKHNGKGTTFVIELPAEEP